jgi:hypothetical protein
MTKDSLNPMDSSLSINKLMGDSAGAASSGSFSGILTIGGVAAASLIPVVGPIVAVGIGTVGAVTTAYQLAMKQMADRKIDRVVQNVQDTLKENGLYTGAVDGVLGPITRAAIVKVQEEKNHLGITGDLDDDTLNAIMEFPSASPVDY